MTRPRTPPPQFDLVANARGLALAAFLPAGTTARMLGCSEEVAATFRENALADFRSLQLAVAQAKAPAR